MYSGIVEGTGTVKYLKQGDVAELTINAPANLLTELALGDSIAVNGVCLTITKLSTHEFSANIVPETFAKTTFLNLVSGNSVNIERPLKQNARNGGHNVQGHVDGVGTVINISPAGSGAILVEIAIPENISPYIVDKGFIAIDGMSITIIDAKAKSFTVTFIPYTQSISIVKHYKVGTKVNLEADVLAKYVEKLIRRQSDVS